MGKSLKGQAGFTLLEVLMVIAMISILAAVSAVSLRNFRPNAELRAATRDLVALMQRGRAEATTRGVNCVINFNAPLGGVNQIAILYADPDNNGQFTAGDTLITSIAPGTYTYVAFNPAVGGGDGLTFGDNGAGNPTVRFFPRGRVNAGGTASLINTEDNTARRDIVVSLAGNIRVQ